MSSYFYIFCKVLLHHFIILYFINYKNHLYTLNFSHKIHPHKHSKNHRGRRACNYLRSGSQAGLYGVGIFSCSSHKVSFLSIIYLISFAILVQVAVRLYFSNNHINKSPENYNCNNYFNDSNSAPYSTGEQSS